jgi:AraC-like DNA-binding protein
MPHHILSAGEQNSRDKSSARLKRLIQFVDENFMHKIRLSDFAEAEGCSVSYLSHFVKETLNQSFQEYVNTVRFNCACKLIASGRRRMLDVCVESGFSDYRYFSRTFQQQVGMTPEEYRLRADRPEQSGAAVKHSLHSLERFYTREQSLELWERFTEN